MFQALDWKGLTCLTLFYGTVITVHSKKKKRNIFSNIKQVYSNLVQSVTSLEPPEQKLLKVKHQPVFVQQENKNCLQSKVTAFIRRAYYSYLKVVVYCIHFAGISCYIKNVHLVDFCICF